MLVLKIKFFQKIFCRIENFLQQEAYNITQLCFAFRKHFIFRLMPYALRHMPDSHIHNDGRPFLVRVFFSFFVTLL